jgi:glyoxylase-like metal-dependent hydrolase (beta-lactamase superfamily II)
MIWFRRLAIVVVALTLVGAASYYWLIMESHMPSTGSYAIDMAQVRSLADSIESGGPTEIRVETVGTITFPKTAVVAGDGWEGTALPVSAFQLVYADKSILLDTGFDEATMKAGDAAVSGYDSAAYQRIVSAMNQAALILITHEHWDHAAGLFAQPNLEKLLSVTKLNAEQVEHADRLVPSVFPEALRQAYKPVSFEKYLAVAPGVVLIRAAGHTPGSQIIYVRRADGREYLFIGDVAWHKRNIDLVRERARLVTWWFLREDHDAVMLQLAELNRLQREEPGMLIMPGHDPAVLANAIEAGHLSKEFK